MEEAQHEEIILQESRSKYEEAWIVEYIIEERNKGKTWEEIAEGLRQRGLDKITGPVCSNVYKKAVARTMVTSTEAKEDFIDFTEMLKGIYGDSIKLMGNYVKALRRINEELEKIEVTDEDGKINVLTTQMSIAKQIPLASSLMKEVREYVKNQISLYDTIEKTKEAEVVWSSEKMMEYIRDFIPTYLKEQEKLGTIKIIDKTILK